MCCTPCSAARNRVQRFYGRRPSQLVKAVREVNGKYWSMVVQQVMRWTLILRKTKHGMEQYSEELLDLKQVALSSNYARYKGYL